jgi:nicotinate-nucleotide adenylyltransferase
VVPVFYDGRMSETPGQQESAGDAGFLAGRRVAFFGGSFDPPHKGHLAVARAAQAGLALDLVLFAPVGVQPLKMPNGERSAAAAFADRLAMTRLAIAGEPGFAVSLMDAPKPAPNAQAPPNYSVETLERLRAEVGSAGRLFFLMGADSFFGLRQWHRAAEIPFAATLVVASRLAASGPVGSGPVENLAAALPAGLRLEPWAEGDAVREGVEVRGFRVTNARGDSAALYLLPGVDERASASEIREEVGADGEAAREWLPATVAAYVREHRLYC